MFSLNGWCSGVHFTFHTFDNFYNKKLGENPVVKKSWKKTKFCTVF